jgi:hypothetical protein
MKNSIQKQHELQNERHELKKERALRNQLAPQQELALAQIVPGNCRSPSRKNDKGQIGAAKFKGNSLLVNPSDPSKITVFQNVGDHVINHHHGAPKQGILKTVRDAVQNGVLLYICFQNVDSRKMLAEFCYTVPGLKESMHLAGFAFDASAALDKCSESKNLQESDSAGSTVCWEYVYDGYQKASLIIHKGKPSYNTGTITKPYLFKLLGGKPQENSASLTPWIAHLTHEEICKVMDDDMNGRIHLGEVDAAKHKFFLVVGIEDQKYVDELKRMLNEKPDTPHYSQCIAWLKTLPKSDPQMPETPY